MPGGGGASREASLEGSGNQPPIFSIACPHIFRFLKWDMAACLRRSVLTSLRQTGNLNVTELTNPEQSRMQDMGPWKRLRPSSPGPASVSRIPDRKPQEALGSINTRKIVGRLLGITDAAGDVLENLYFWFKNQ